MFNKIPKKIVAEEVTPFRRFTLMKPVTLSKESSAVVDLLRKHLKAAEAGEIHGICIAVDLEGHKYDFDCAGTYDEYPTEALGPLGVLTLKLTRRALDGDR